jgi:hypothetical protein
MMKNSTIFTSLRPKYHLDSNSSKIHSNLSELIGSEPSFSRSPAGKWDFGGIKASRPSHRHWSITEGTILPITGSLVFNDGFVFTPVRNTDRF